MHNLVRKCNLILGHCCSSSTSDFLSYQPVYQRSRWPGSITIPFYRSIRTLLAAACFHDSVKSGQDGRDDEHPDTGFSREYFFKCPDNDKEYKVFGESHIDEIAEKHGLKVLANIPIDPKISAACDAGMIELFDGNWFDSVAEGLASQIGELGERRGKWRDCKRRNGAKSRP